MDDKYLGTMILTAGLVSSNEFQLTANKTYDYGRRRLKLKIMYIALFCIDSSCCDWTRVMA